MTKPINYRCPECGEDREIWGDEVTPGGWVHCIECDRPMVPFNFKNNAQQWVWDQDES